MDSLVDDGFVVLGGPLGDAERILLIVDAGTEHEIRERLADDPWTRSGLLEIARIETWDILLDGVDGSAG